MLVAIACLACLVAADTKPQMNYRFTSFSTPDPVASAAMLAKYTDGGLLLPSEMLAEYAGASAKTVTAGVRLPYEGGSSDMYFFWDPLAPGADDVVKFSEALEKSHTYSQDDWDWWQDWHFAYHVSDLDAVATRFFKDGVKFVNRGGSLYYMLPGGLTVQVLGSASIYWGEKFLFCRRTTDDTTGRMPYYTTNVTDIDALPITPLPLFRPSHQSLAASDAPSAAAWTLKFLSFAAVDTLAKPGQTHEYADGTCADIEWLEVSPNGWEVHYIQQYVKREGLVRVAPHEALVNGLHARHNLTHAYSGMRVGFSVSSITPFAEAFAAAGQQMLTSNGRLLVSAPTGQLFELFEDSAENTLEAPGCGKKDDIHC